MAAAVPSPTRRRSILVLKAVISIGLLGLLLSSVDLARLWATARTASPAWMCLALALYAVMCLLWSHTPADFPNYAAGSMGPKESDALLAKDGFIWWPLD